MYARRRPAGARCGVDSCKADWCSVVLALECTCVAGPLAFQSFLGGSQIEIYDTNREKVLK